MKPEPRRSPGCDPAQHKKLSVKMKSQLKVKSPDIPPTRSRRVPLSKQLTSTSIKASVRPNCKPKLVENVTKSEDNLAGISPIKESYSQPQQGFISTRNIFKPSTPKIVISKSAHTYIESAFNMTAQVDTEDGRKTCIVDNNLQTSKESSGLKRTVPRSKVRSPVNSRSSLTKDLPRTITSKNRLEELEVKLKKKDLEIINLNRKVNTLQKTLSVKENSIKDLEHKLPKMLNELRKGIDDDGDKKKINKELKESIKRNRNISGNMRQVEDQLKVKEEKLKEAMTSKKRALDQLKCIEKESKDCFHRTVAAEKKVLQLQDKLEQNEDDLAKERDNVGFLEHRLSILGQEKFDNNDQIERLEAEVTCLKNVLSARDVELSSLNQENSDLNREIQEQYINLGKTEQEIQNYVRVIDQIKNQMTFGSSHENRRSIDLDKATEEFLDKVQTVSKNNNVTVNLKLTVRKSTLNSTLDQSHIFRNDLHKSLSNNNTASFSANVRKELFNDEGNVETSRFNVFPDSDDEGMIVDDTSGEVFEEDISNSTTASNFTVSSATLDRVEILDQRVQQLWSRLSAKDDMVDRDQVRIFSDSVDQLEQDLNQSMKHHDNLLHQVNVVKRYFN